jgi:glycerophosphoryl diester phosphodiesterase
MLRIADLSALAREPARGGQRSPGLYLETKDPDKYPGYEQQLVELLGAAGWLAAPPPGAPPPLLFQSFDEASLQRLAALAPAVPRVLLIEDNAESRAKWGELLKRGRALGMGIGPSGHEGWPWFTGAAHRAGLQVHLYTINEAWQLRLLRQFGADGFFTDTADLALAVLGRGADPGLDREQARAAAFARAGL